MTKALIISLPETGKYHLTWIDGNGDQHTKHLSSIDRVQHYISELFDDTESIKIGGTA